MTAPNLRPGCQRPRCTARGRYAVMDTRTGEVVTVCGVHMSWLADFYDLADYLVADIVALPDPAPDAA